jgi:hypothetical protein
MRAGAPLLIGVIALGAAVRLVGGVPLVQTDLVMGPEASDVAAAAGAPAAGAPAAVGASGAPEAAAASFYSFLQQGEYDKAWEVSLEPEWAGSSTASYGKEIAPSPRASGWTRETDFIRRCADDIGPGMKLNAVEVVRLPSVPETPEGRAVSALGASRLFGVRARGHMLGACMIYRWERDLVVAEIGGRYKVLLPGTKAARASFHQEWFSNLSLIGSLRASGK